MFPTAVAISALLFAVMASADHSRTIYVDPEKGTNTEDCLQSPSPDQACKNLSYVLQPRFRASYTRYLLQPGTHYLNGTASDQPFSRLSDIAVVGNTNTNDSVKIVCFVDNAGFSFWSSKQVTFENLTVTNCSSWQNGTSKNNSNSGLCLIHTALYYSHCENVTLERIVVSQSPNASAVTIYNTVGTNTFTQCYFINNSGPVSSTYSSGGGVYIEFSYCSPGNTSCSNTTEQSYTDFNSKSRYNFTECVFANNSATLSPSDNTLQFVSQKQNHVSFGQGGGLSIFFCGDANNNIVWINSCNFSENTARIGGGLFVGFWDTSDGNSVNIGSEFVGNNCTDHGRGGGVNVDHFLFPIDSSLEGNAVSFTESNFTGNTAWKGGGLRVVASSHAPFNISLSGVTFEANHARYGAGFMSQMSRTSLERLVPSLLIQNCVFLNNTVKNGTYTGPFEIGLGAVYIEDIDVTFNGTNLLANNHGTALVLVGAIADITNTSMMFTRNEGVNGGALYLLASAKILISNTTQVLFDSNRAYVAGGAIFNKYTEQNTYEYITNCFIVHENGTLSPDEWGARFTFGDNYDSTGRNAIHSTSILSCGATPKSHLNNTFCWANWNYSYDGERECDCSKLIRTAPGKIEVNASDSSSGGFTILAYPGEIKEIPIEIFDDLNHPTKAIFSAGCKLFAGSASLDPDYAFVSTKTVRVLGSPSGSVHIYLNSLGDRIWYVKFSVNLTECPPGLVPQPTPETYTCNESRHSSGGGQQWDDVSLDSCESSTYTCGCVAPQGNIFNLHCNSATNVSLLNGYWMGLENVGGERQYMVSACPSGFCMTANHEYNPLPRDNLTKHICGVQGRRGRVCGECMEGFGPAINSDSFECVSCTLSFKQLTLHITYYILLVYVPLFFLFLVIILFNVKLTTGPANAFILYSQVISSTLNINADNRIPLSSITPHITRYLNAYMFPYGVFNLKFFELFVPKRYLCFGTHLNSLDLFLLEYLVASFPLLMIVAILVVYKFSWICNRCPVHARKLCRVCQLCCCCCRFSRNRETFEDSSDRLRRAMVPAFASFILLSYTKFSLTSSLIITPVHLSTLSGKTLSPAYFSFAGQKRYSAPENILRYVLPASVVFATFVAIPPLMLLDYPLRLFEGVLRRCPLLWRVYPSAKIHIMLDAFQGCYRDNYRWFAGLYFIFRLIINVTNAVYEDLKQFVLQEIYCIVFALLVAFLRPYRRKYHLLNYFDSFIFLNMAAINLITLYLYADTRRGSNPSPLVFAIQYILVFLPLLYMVGYVSWCLMPVPRVRERVREWMEERHRTQQLENLIQNRSEETSDAPDDVDWERAEVVNRYKALKSSDGPLHSSVPPPDKQSSVDQGTSGTSNKPTSSTTLEGAGSTGGGYGSTDSGVAVVNRSGTRGTTSLSIVSSTSEEED